MQPKVKLLGVWVFLIFLRGIVMFDQVDTQNYVPLLKDIRDQLGREKVSYSGTDLDYTVRLGAEMNYEDIVVALTSLQAQYAEGSGQNFLLGRLIQDTHIFEQTAIARQLLQYEANYMFWQMHAHADGPLAANYYDDNYEVVTTGDTLDGDN